MESYLKTNKVTITNTVDENGVLLESVEDKDVILINNKEEFFLCYDALLYLINNMSIAEVRTYMWLLSQYADGKRFSLDKSIRLLIADSTNLNERSIYNITPNLVKKKLIVKVEYDLYVINPRYAFKGSSSLRAKKLKDLIISHCPNC